MPPARRPSEDSADAPRARRAGHLRRLLLGLLIASSWPGLAHGYELGHGYPLPFLGLSAGGYYNIQAASLAGEPTRASLQVLSLFLHGNPRPDWHFFTEIEANNVLTWSEGNAHRPEADLDVERFYLDHNLSTRSTVRFGKFLTPIGRWNQIHADPLVWTVSRPLTTIAAFAPSASGAQLYGSWPVRKAAIDYQLYVDDSAQLDPTIGHEETYPDLAVRPNPQNAFNQGVGARLRYRSFNDDLQLGLSIAHFALRELQGYKNLVGADLFYTRHEAELTGEMVYRRDDNGGGKEWGGFLLLAVPLWDHVYGVAYHERFKAELFSVPVDTTSVGITYRPTPPFSIKIEHRQSTGTASLAPTGWLFSVTALF
ncbi:MAG: hypothetical protein M0037_07585 [Betaproteobacteria bacterium]|nr:hypothetical protein [Betaproteobacteria bacterium]